MSDGLHIYKGYTLHNPRQKKDHYGFETGPRFAADVHSPDGEKIDTVEATGDWGLRIMAKDAAKSHLRQIKKRDKVLAMVESAAPEDVVPAPDVALSNFVDSFVLANGDFLTDNFAPGDRERLLQNLAKRFEIRVRR